jgi:hypothetical protein
MTPREKNGATNLIAIIVVVALVLLNCTYGIDILDKVGR